MIILGALAAVLTLASGADAISDKEIITMTILAEARGEGQSGMYAVAAVISQRALNRQLSARKICLQRKQFSCWNSGKSLKHLLLHPEAKYASYLADNIKKLDRSYVGYADHYHNINVKPYWANKDKKIRTIKNHVFYKLN